MRYSLALITAVFFISIDALACVCVERTDVEKFTSADEVLYVQGTGTLKEIDSKNYGEFRVLEVFKGESKTGALIEINTFYGSSCSAPTDYPHKFVFFAAKDLDGVLLVSACSFKLMERVEYDGESFGPTDDEVEQELNALRKMMFKKSSNSDASDTGAGQFGR